MGSAFAGEISGPPDGHGTGGLTPIAGYVAHSICAFSGLQRFHEGKPATVWPPVQTYGAIVAAGEMAYAPARGMPATATRASSRVPDDPYGP